MQIIDGKNIAKQIRAKVKEEIKCLGISPGLAVILVGSNPASHLYVSLKEKVAAEVGIKFEKYFYSTDVEEKEVIKKIKELNKNPRVHGILVQLPLPKGLDENKIIASINPQKDVDGFHPENIKKLLINNPVIIPGLAWGILKLIQSTGRDLQNKKAVIICNSKEFAIPIKKLLKNKGARVIDKRADDEGLAGYIKNADILVVAVGRPGFITAEMIKEGAVVIDVGTNKINSKTVGDVEFAGTLNKTGFITPVPGGVGPVTVAILLRNTLEIAKKRKN